MDRKAKKRIEVLQKSRQKLLGQLSVVKRFTDEPAEIPRLQEQIAKIEAELARLRQQG
jgi:hypothetical protein